MPLVTGSSASWRVRPFEWAAKVVRSSEKAWRLSTERVNCWDTRCISTARTRDGRSVLYVPHLRCGTLRRSHDFVTSARLTQDADSGGSSGAASWTRSLKARRSNGNCGRLHTAFGITSRIPVSFPRLKISRLNGLEPYLENEKAGDSKVTI